MTSTEAPSLSQAVKVAAAPAGSMEALRERPRRGRGLSLRTLIVLRWLAILGQSAAILTAYFIAIYAGAAAGAVCARARCPGACCTA